MHPTCPRCAIYSVWFLFQYPYWRWLSRLDVRFCNYGQWFIAWVITSTYTRSHIKFQSPFWSGCSINGLTFDSEGHFRANWWYIVYMCVILSNGKHWSCWISHINPNSRVSVQGGKTAVWHPRTSCRQSEQEAVGVGVFPTWHRARDILGLNHTKAQ